MGRSAGHRPSTEDFDSPTANPAHPCSKSKHEKHKHEKHKKTIADENLRGAIRLTRNDSTSMTRTPQA